MNIEFSMKKGLEVLCVLSLLNGCSMSIDDRENYQTENYQKINYERDSIDTSMIVLKFGKYKDRKKDYKKY